MATLLARRALVLVERVEEMMICIIKTLCIILI